MDRKAVGAAGWEFARFQLMPQQRLLLNDGSPVPLTSKAFDTLVFLVENRDRVVTKDELLRAVWPDVIVEEGNLTQQIFLLRKAFGESAQHPRYIVTVPGHGYRFTAPVKEVSADTGNDSEIAARAVTPQPARLLRAQLYVKAGIVLAGILAIAGVVFVIKGIAPPARRAWLDSAHLRITKVTETGKATSAAISPSGRYVAYADNDGDEYSLVVQQIATGGKTEVVAREPRMLGSLTFSPDGHYLYFTRGVLNKGGFVLHRVPAIGGPEMPVLDDVDTAVSFSPDGRQFVFMRGAGSETHIVIANADGSAQRVLATRKLPLRFWYVAPAWSPDGRFVAASAGDGTQRVRSSIVLIPLDGGASRELYTSDHRIGAVRWLADGSGLLTVVSETLARQFAPWLTPTVPFSGGPIWRIGYPSGSAERLTPDLAEYDLCCVDVAADGSSIVGVVNSLVSDLWIAPADELQAPRQITWGSPTLGRHTWLPDNDTIVYRDIAGRLNAVRKDGRGFRLAVPEGRRVVGGVSACGDGRYVVFAATPGNNLWRVTPDAGGAVQLTNGSADFGPACSADGKSVVYASMRGDVASLWRISTEGGDPALLVQSHGGTFDALPSPRGGMIGYHAFEWDEQPVRIRRMRWIVISSADRTRLYTLNAPDATLGLPPIPSAWAPDESGLDYVVTRNGVSNIWRLPLAGGPPTQVTRFNSGRIFSFAWSRDGKWLSLGSGANRSDVVLISRQP
jgi:DNA-binding winged helix-turn-helix (wHTH) protein/Tol biopolymer transport system component